MIVLDIKASGIDTGKCGIWQIGAIDLNSGKEFLEESKIDNDDLIMEEALKVTGKKEEELRKKSKQSQKQLIENFLKWLKQSDERILAGQNIGFDIMFIQNKCARYNLMEKFREVIGQRSIDLHTLAQLVFKKQNGKYKLKNGKSNMNLNGILEFLGLEDPRRLVQSGKIVKEGNVHNALEDCKLEAECFKKLMRELEK